MDSPSPSGRLDPSLFGESNRGTSSSSSSRISWSGTSGKACGSLGRGLLLNLCSAKALATGRFFAVLSSQELQASGTVSRLSPTVPRGSNLRICCFAANLSLKVCLPHCLLAADSARPAKFKFCLGLGTLLNWIRGTPCNVLLLLFLLFFSCGAVLPAATGAGLPATRSFSTTPRCLLSVLLTLFLGFSTLSPSSTTVLAWPSVELLRPSNSGNRASARACCASWRLWRPLRTLSSCFSFDLFPLLFFLGAVLPKKQVRGATRRTKCPRGYPQSTSPGRSWDQPRAPLPCDGGTTHQKHKKANQLTQTFSHCLRCTWVHRKRGAADATTSTTIQHAIMGSCIGLYS